MNLQPKELVQLYEAVIKPFGHPDPLGYLTRAIIASEADPDYIDMDGLIGFMPVDPERALGMVGAQEVQSLESNIVSTLAMDRLLFDQYQSVDRMIVAFHFGDEAVGDELTTEQVAFIDDVNESRPEVLALLYPPLATVADVVRSIKESQDGRNMTSDELSFFNELLNSGTS